VYVQFHLWKFRNFNFKNNIFWPQISNKYTKINTPIWMNEQTVTVGIDVAKASDIFMSGHLYIVKQNLHTVSYNYVGNCAI
jgi:hypothetical protein